MRPKHKLFADEYLIDMNPVSAYMKVYKCKESTAKVNAYKLLENTSVSAYVEEKQNEASEKSGLSKEWVLRRLRTISDRCIQEEPVYDNQGNPTGEYKFDSAGANRSTELIGKHLGMFKDKLELSGETGVKIINDIPRNKG